jgi:hypothetical protein
MSDLKRMYELPLSSRKFRNVELSEDILHFDYLRDGARYRGGIRFKRVSASLYHAERCETAWHIEAADELVEVENSEWLKQVRAQTMKTYRDREMHHYMIRLDSTGVYEIIAESWEVLPEQEGTWPMISPD